MSDLPSPERMRGLSKSLDAVSLENGRLVDEILDTIRARAEGRLVDREAFNYEAEARKVHALMRVAFNQYPDESGKGKPWDDLDEISKVGLIAMARARVDAALGDAALPEVMT